MPAQPAALRRCATCNRWQGRRQPSEDGSAALIDAETIAGLCQGGPWDGEERRARAACGRWTIWLALATDGT